MKNLTSRISAFGDTHLPIKSYVNDYNVPKDYFTKLILDLRNQNPDILLIAGDLLSEHCVNDYESELDHIRALPGKIKIFPISTVVQIYIILEDVPAYLN
jgi:hypothetical protein